MKSLRITEAWDRFRARHFHHYIEKESDLVDMAEQLKISNPSSILTQQDIDRWNEEFPVGTECFRITGDVSEAANPVKDIGWVLRQQGSFYKTISPAWLLSSGHGVVRLNVCKQNFQVVPLIRIRMASVSNLE